MSGVGSKIVIGRRSGTAYVVPLSRQMPVCAWRPADSIPHRTPIGDDVRHQNEIVPRASGADRRALAVLRAQPTKNEVRKRGQRTAPRPLQRLVR
jgi:hypothetical protein